MQVEAIENFFLKTKMPQRRDNAGAVSNSGMGMLFLCIYLFYIISLRGVLNFFMHDAWCIMQDARCIIHDGGLVFFSAYMHISDAVYISSIMWNSFSSLDSW